MTTLTTCRTRNKHSFDTVVQPFLNNQALPFSEVLSDEDIHRVFAEHNALFAQDEIYWTQLVLRAFLAQVLQDDKGAACSAAVANIATYAQQLDLPAPCGDTGDYCRARAKLPPQGLHDLVSQSADQLESQGFASGASPPSVGRSPVSPSISNSHGTPAAIC